MIKKLLRKLVRLPVVRNLIGLSKKIHPPGFEGVSLYEVFAFFFRGIFKGGVQNRASAMAFSFFLAVFPGIIFLFTVIPYIPVAGTEATLLDVIRELLPVKMFQSLESAIKEITRQPSGGLVSFGFLAALYFSKNGLVAMMNAFNNSIHVTENRPVWKQQLVATVLVLMFATLILSGLTLMIGSEYILAKMVHRENSEHIWIEIGRWLVLAFLFLVIIGMFYRFGPARRRHRIFFSPGVLTASVLTIATSLLFSWYVNNYARYNSIYGSMGTIMVVMLWIYFNSVMLLIGFELDAGIHSAHAKKRTLLEQEEAEEKAAEEAEAKTEKAVSEA